MIRYKCLKTWDTYSWNWHEFICRPDKYNNIAYITWHELNKKQVFKLINWEHILLHEWQIEECIKFLDWISKEL